MTVTQSKQKNQDKQWNAIEKIQPAVLIQ